MKPHPLLLLAGIVLGASPALAQHFLAVKDGDKQLIVVAARGTEPMVLAGGKLQALPANRFALGDGGEYLPCYVVVRHVHVETSALLANGSDEINKEFSFSGELETNYRLAHVFLVIALHPDFGEQSLFLYEVGDLAPREPRPIRVRVPMIGSNSPGKYEFYLFSGGRELFQTLMPIGAAEATLNRMVHERVKDLQNAPPQPFIGPTPEYPAALYKRGVNGSATIAFTIAANGAVYDATVQAGSRPEFGEAALAVMRDWRFLPKVRNGVPVETKATMPFDFTVPKKK